MKIPVVATCALAAGVMTMGCGSRYAAEAEQAASRPLALAGMGSEVPRPAIVSAEEWGSDPDPIPESRRHVPRHLTVHHAGVTWTEQHEPVTQLRNLQSWGKSDRDWPDLPYHFLIAPDGRIFEGRSLEYEPETNTDYDTSGHIGIQLWGSFGVQRASIEQMESLVALLAWLGSEYQIAPATIQGHMDVAQTACPGADLYRYIEDGTIAQWVELTFAGQDPEVELKPALAGGPTEIIPGGSAGQ